MSSMTITDFYLILIALICAFALLSAVHYGRPLMFVMSLGMTGILVSAPVEVGFPLLFLAGLMVYFWVKRYGWKLP